MGWFSKKLKVQSPYDTLTVEQQRALYFLLEFFSEFTVDSSFGVVSSDAFNYLKKATWYLGLSNKDIKICRPYYKNLDDIYNKMRGIENKLALDFMVNNSYNLVILSRGDNYKSSCEVFYAFWQRFGYSESDIYHITQKYMYRTDI